MSVTAHPVRCRRLLLVVLLSAMMALAACGESTQASGKAGTKNTPTSGNVSGNGTPTSGNVDSGGSSGALVWSGPITIDSNGQSSFSVSCSSANFCAAVHTSQDANGNGEATTYNGNFWAALTIFNGNDGLNAVSCPTNGFCIAVGASDMDTYSNGIWSSGATIDTEGTLDSISCPTTSFCAAIDTVGNAFTYDGSTWSSAANIDNGGALASVSCPATRFCAAIDVNGNVLAYSGESWTNTTTLGTDGTLTSLSCPAVRFCVAIDDSHAYIYSGSSWTGPTTLESGGSQLNAVSCATASFCVAVDDVGNVLTYNGSSWTSTPAIDNGGSLAALSCPTARFCVAADLKGNAVTGRGTAAPTNGSATTATTLALSLGDIRACSLLTSTEAQSLISDVAPVGQEDDNSYGSLCEYSNDPNSPITELVHLQVALLNESWSALMQGAAHIAADPASNDDTSADFEAVSGLGDHAEEEYEAKTAGGSDQGIVWTQGGLFFELGVRSLGSGGSTANNWPAVLTVAKKINGEL